MAKLKVGRYKIDLVKLASNIKKNNSKKVLLQLPDGLKQYALTIKQNLQKKLNNTDLYLYMGSNFGACDIPYFVQTVGIDLIVNFGHTYAVFDKTKQIT